MILAQKNIRYLLLSIIICYLLFYVLISKFKIVHIENLSSIRYVVILIFFAGIISSYFLFNKELQMKWVFYEIFGIALILFCITSIFVFNVEDLFFWDTEKELHKQFFKFSFELLGWNYILALPYLILIIFECSILLQNRNRLDKKIP